MAVTVVLIWEAYCNRVLERVVGSIQKYVACLKSYFMWSHADPYQSERQSDGSREESEEPASYDNDLVQYDGGQDGKPNCLWM